MRNENATTLNQITDLIFERISSSIRKNNSSRYTYIIGNNGTGKSRILGELAELLKNKKTDKIVACIASTIYDRFTHGDHKTVKYMGARNSTNAVFLATIDRQLARFILQAMQIDRRLFKHLSEAVNMDLSYSIDKSSLHELLSPSVRSTRNRERITKKALTLGLTGSRSFAMLTRIANNQGRFELLTDAQIKLLIDYLEINIDFKVKVKTSNSDWVEYGALSSGEQNRLLLFSKIASVLQEGITYLIDEPEISMHLHWQMDFHKTLKKLLSTLDRYHVVIATHSPIIISEAVKTDLENTDNMVVVLRRESTQQTNTNDSPIESGPIACKFHKFSEVASHEQLVLKYFQTSPYQAREVTVEIADTVLSLVEGEKDKKETIRLLSDLLNVVGLSSEAKQQIYSALDLVRKDIATTIKYNGER